MSLPMLQDFPAQNHDKLRFGDTDMLGHVNNAVFVTFLETGRTGLVHLLRPLLTGEMVFVIAHLSLDYRKEVFWPGTVEIGTGVKAVGRSSIRFTQALFQNGQCVATAETVVVQMDKTIRRAAPLPDGIEAALAKWMMK